MKKNNNFTLTYAYLSILCILCTLISHTIYATPNDEISDDETRLELLHQENHKQNEKFLDDLSSGAFLMRGQKGDIYTPALLTKTQASIDISGPLAQTELTQEFYNNSYDFAEGIYVFPLPDNAAVDHMEVIIGHRRIIGKILEKKEAKRIYEQAKRQGKRTALVEQHRPNLFRTSVANIPANETVKITIRFNQSLQVQRTSSNTPNLYEYRLPLSFTPRFNPKQKNDANGQDNPISSVHIAANNKLGVRNPINIQIRFHKNINGVFDTVNSLYHTIHKNIVDDVLHMNLEREIPMDRDFVLEWKANPNNSLEPVFYTETVEGEHYGLLMLNPPYIYQRKEHLPREVIYVIDSSGSMGGTSMDQAIKSLLKALDELTPIDRFNVIDFDSVHRVLFNKPEYADVEQLTKARRFVKKLDANGGTNMRPALEAALSMQSSDDEYLKQIIFITDGAISNEQQLFTLLHQSLGKARFFTVGIGSAPNSYFMRKAAEFGRGTFTHIGSLEEVDERMSELFLKLGNPVLQNLKLNFAKDIMIEQWPQTLPDLYAGEALIVPIKFNRRPESVLLSGFSEAHWQQDIRIDQNQENPGISKLWARAKIQTLMDSLARGQSIDTVKPQVLNIALRHSLLSQYTSFVAVDETPVRPNDQVLKKSIVPNLIPKGHNYPQTALGIRFWYLIAFLSLGLLLITSKRSTRRG